MIWQIMSDKQNNLNKNDDNIQFDKVANNDQQDADRSPVNTGTAPLKRLKPREPQIVSSSPKADDSTNNAGKKRLPLTGKLPDLSESEMLDALQGNTDDKLPSKPLDTPVESSPILADTSPPSEDDESKIEKPLKATTFPVEKEDFLDKPETKKLADSGDGTLRSGKLSGKSDLDKILDSESFHNDTLAIPERSRPSSPNTKDNSGNLSDSPEKSSEIPFQTSNQDKADDKPHTYMRRSEFDILKNRASVVSFKNKKDENPPEKNPDTAILPDKSPAWKKVIDGQAQGTTGSIGEQREVLFVIRGMIERVVMKDNTTATLGRFDTGTVPNEEIDLIPYGAIDRGVSRRHCEILLRDNHLHVVDLGSTNGTFLAGVRLKPNEATLLRKGDELLLGRLAVQVLFR